MSLALLHGLPLFEWRKSPLFPEGGYHVPALGYGRSLSEAFSVVSRASARIAIEKYNNNNKKKA